tara:strand:+ start:998 stop:1189 length:192 start_codon:yes stop_codon:yes gene_type:complete
MTNKIEKFLIKQKKYAKKRWNAGDFILEDQEETIEGIKKYLKEDAKKKRQKIKKKFKNLKDFF